LFLNKSFEAYAFKQNLIFCFQEIQLRFYTIIIYEIHKILCSKQRSSFKNIIEIGMNEFKLLRSLIFKLLWKGFSKLFPTSQPSQIHVMRWSLGTLVAIPLLERWYIFRKFRWPIQWCYNKIIWPLLSTILI
jgi:hypothetical protein